MRLGNLFRQFHRQFHGKRGPLSFFAPDRDRAAHHVQQVFGNGQSQARADRPGFGGGHLPFKRLIHPLHKPFRHANAVVFDGEGVACVAGFGHLFLTGGDAYRSVRGGELDRVADKIAQNPAEAVGVYQNLSLRQVQLFRKREIFLLSLCAEEVQHHADLLPQIAGFRFHLHMPVFNFAHFQQIVDQGQKLAAGFIHLAQIVLKAFRLMNVPLGQV